MFRDHVPLAGRTVMYIKAFKKNYIYIYIYISGYSMIYNEDETEIHVYICFLRYKSVMRKPKEP